MYFWIITVAMFLTYTCTIPLSTCVNFYSIAEALCGPIIINAFVLILMGIVRLIMGLCIPSKNLNYNSSIFKVSKKQYLFVKRLKVGKWKDKVPEMGKTSNFPKDKVYSFELSYLKRFLQETCFAELLHILSGVIPFLILPFVSIKSYIYVIPVLIINLTLHILPCLIQRYVRFKLSNVYEKKLQREIKY